MTKPAGIPPFPNSPGAWIACFRHRVPADRPPVSPEDFAKLIDRSGSTVRRWEADTKVPDERDIARIAEACDMTPLQVAFLSAACTRMRALPAPDKGPFIDYMTEQLCSTPYPAILHDGLFFIRGWNSCVDAIARGATRTFKQDIHPMAMMIRAGPSSWLGSMEYEETLREAIRIFWMSTAVHSHRPEYADMLAELDQEPQFRKLWLELAFCRGAAPPEPISFAYSLGSAGARFRVYSRTITFPPTYYLNEYHPDDDISRRQLDVIRAEGAPRAFFKRELHWVKPSSSCS